MYGHKEACRIALISLPIMILSGLNPIVASPQRNGVDWSFLDPYAVALIVEAHGTDYPALERAESAASKDSKPLAKSYVHLARALQARMQFRFADADQEAIECIKIAEDSHNDTAQALCGWLRLNLARMSGDFAAMVKISNDMSAINRRLLSRAGMTQEDAAKSGSLFFLSEAASYQDMASWPKPTVEKSKSTSKVVKLDTSHNKYLLVNAEINGAPTKFDVDTGSGYTIISPELAKRMNITISKHKEYVADIHGNPTLYDVGLIQTLNLGTVTVHNFPVLVGANGFDYPILGMDYFFHVGTFVFSGGELVIEESPVDTCSTPARLRSSIAPDSPLVGVAIHTNFGELYGSLDTGASDIGYALGDWKIREKIGVGRQFELKTQVTDSLSGRSTNGYVGEQIQLFINDGVFDRELRLYPDLALNTDIVMSADAIKDFSFYYDLPRGMACISAIDHDVTKLSKRTQFRGASHEPR